MTAGVDTVELQHVSGRPTRRVCQFVTHYGGFRHAGYAPSMHHGLPSRFVTFIVAIGTPVHIVRFPDGSPVSATFDAFVGGLHTAPAMIADPGHGEGISIDVSPFACRALFGMPASELAGTVVDLRELWGTRADELVERVATAPTWRERFDAIDAVLATAALDARGAAPEIGAAWSVLVAQRGTTSIGALADETGWSRRHLAGRFRAELGVSPKAAARVMRFEHARWMLDHDPQLGLAHVAAMSGYADQAHFTREWRSLTGMTPSS